MAIGNEKRIFGGITNKVLRREKKVIEKIKELIMKQIFLFLIVFLFLLQGIAFSKDVKITAHNNSKLTKIISFLWTNNPAGCYEGFFGDLRCVYSMWVSEIEPGETNFHIVEDAVGKEYCAEWKNIIDNERTDKSITTMCFEITEDIEEVYITPNKIIKKPEGIPI